MSAAYGGQCAGENMDEYLKWRALWQATGDPRYVSLAPGGKKSDEVSAAVGRRGVRVLWISIACASLLVGLVIFLLFWFSGVEAFHEFCPELIVALVVVAVMVLWVGRQVWFCVLKPA